MRGGDWRGTSDQGSRPSRGTRTTSRHGRPAAKTRFACPSRRTQRCGARRRQQGPLTATQHGLSGSGIPAQRGTTRSCVLAPMTPGGLDRTGPTPTGSTTTSVVRALPDSAPSAQPSVVVVLPAMCGFVTVGGAVPGATIPVLGTNTPHHAVLPGGVLCGTRAQDRTRGIAPQQVKRGHNEKLGGAGKEVSSPRE